MSFQEFWPRYLRAHASPKTRTLHVAGTIVGTALVVGAIASRTPLLAVAGLVCGYGPAWCSHALIEHNKPETFRAPLSSLRGDFLMAWHILRGTIDGELRRAGVDEPYSAR